MKLKTTIYFFLFVAVVTAIAFAISYKAVHTYSFLPFGYDIEWMEEEKLVVKSLNFYGKEVDRHKIVAIEADDWYMRYIKENVINDVEGQKNYYIVLFTFLIPVITSIVFTIKQEKSWLNKGLTCFTILISYFTVIIQLLYLLKWIGSDLSKLL